MGVRLRATLAATLTVAVALALASFALFSALHASLERSTRQEAEANAAAAATAVTEHGTASVPENTGTQVLDGGPSFTTAWTDRAGGHLVVEQTVPTADGPVTVQGRASLVFAREALETLRRLLAPGVPLLLGLVALLTWAAVGRALKPVSAIRAKVADITANDLHERVPEPRARDEIRALARTVNGTLDRLQSAVEAHRQFVADAAHELRSPLTILRTRLELADPSPLASQALADVERLQSLTTDLLLLARLDAGEPARHEEVDLAQIVAEEAAQQRPRPDVKVIMDLAPDLLVHGSPGRLRRLVANLVDNAVRHARTTVAVRLNARDGAAVLLITDDGPGIPDEHRHTVFDRFARLDHARARDSGGSGLGLAIARDIAAAHAGTLQLTDRTEGTGMRVVIPLYETAVAQEKRQA
ncbi:sensor histidine kinase [Actinocorallia populi]|uniref:sensor histidine kinase n=1 Tax=Actinocorallia populi TaxID=2079200 RepID=UPI001E4DBE57|nr:ATP-binding protein [Actinocorallia populi]